MTMKSPAVRGPQINQFNNIAPQKIPRSQFIRDFTRRTTFNADYIVPCFVDEILPGDDVNIKMNAVVRMATPIKPLMDNLYLETHWFFVPNRLVWDNWEKFQGQQTNPGDSTAYTIPVLNHLVEPLSTTGFETESVYDYFGLPILVSGIEKISAMYNRAYDLIWNAWYRDENLQSSITVPTGDGPDNPALYELRKRNKRKDYFTSMLPWPQKGDAAAIPLAGNAPVISTENPIQFKDAPGAGLNRNLQFVAGNTINYTGPVPAGNPNLRFGTDTGLEVDFTELSAVTINALRQTALYQQILELDARGGTRYVESIYTRFGVVSPDFRLQLPELIGQASTRINVYAVPQTAPTTDTSTPQGNLAAFGIAQISGDHGCRYAATEHGMILGLMNVRADLTYQQGVPRMFSRQTRLDFYEPLLNGLGEQAIPRKELYAEGTPVSDNETIGYQERFSEYRFKNSEITGKFRSAAPLTMDIWHLAQFFSEAPALNSAFITENVPMDRVLAVTDESDFLADMAFSYNHVRPMPIRSNPGITKL
nr:MAG: major capsid protein [Microvirus sp.]